MDISDAPQYENALKQQEKLLRNCKIRSCLELSGLVDQYDSIDLTGNQLTELTDSIPRLPRLKTLLLTHNHIRSIDPSVSKLFPNLTTLSLAHNRLKSTEELLFLRNLSKLTYLSLEGNPVTEDPGFRKSILRIQPSVRFINYARVTAHERTAANPEKSAEEQNKEKKLLERLENATSIEEIDAIEAELASLNK